MGLSPLSMAGAGRGNVFASPQGPAETTGTMANNSTNSIFSSPGGSETTGTMASIFSGGGAGGGNAVGGGGSLFS